MVTFPTLTNQFSSYLPNDNTSALTHAELSSALDAVYNAAGIAALNQAVVSLAVPLATTTIAGSIKPSGSSFSFASDNSMTPIFGNTSGSFMQGNDSRVVNNTAAIATMQAANYLTASTAATSVNGMVGTVSLSTSSLADVSKTKPVAGQVLTYLNGMWTPQVPAASGAASTFQGLSDVQVPSYTTGNILSVSNSKIVSIAPPYVLSAGGTYTGSVSVPNTSYPNITSTNAVNAVYVQAAKADIQATLVSSAAALPAGYAKTGLEMFLMSTGGTTPVNYTLTPSQLQTFLTASTVSNSGTTFTESSQGTAVTSVGPSLTDQYDNVYTISSGGQVVTNGVAETTTSNVVELYYSGHQMYQSNASGNWYVRTITGQGQFGTYTQTTSPIPGIVAAASTVSANPASLTGQVVPATLFGVGTAALFDNNAGDMANSSFLTTAKTLTVSLLRSNWGTQGGVFTDIFSSATATPNFGRISNYVNNVNATFPGTRQLITLGLAGWMNTSNATDQASYAQCAVKLAAYLAQQGAPCFYYAMTNENDNMNITDFCNCFNALSSALKAYNPAIQVGGLTDSYSHIDRFQTFLASCKPDFLDYHYYAVLDDLTTEQGGADAALMQKAITSAQPAISLRAAVGGSLPIFLGEWNIDGYWYAGGGIANYYAGGIMTTYKNAVFSALVTYAHIKANVNVTMGGMWEIVSDSDYGWVPNPNSSNVIPAGLFMSQAAKIMGGSLFATGIGSNLTNFVSYGTAPSSGSWSLMLVNYDTSTSRTIAVNVTGGTGNVAYWEIGSAHQTAPLVQTVAYSSLSSVTVAPMTVIMLSSTSAAVTPAPVTYSTWDSTRAAAPITLSNNFMTASILSGTSGAGGIRGTLGRNANLYCFEMVASPATTDLNCGLCNSTSASTQAYLGSDNNSIGITPYNPNSPAAAPYDVISINGAKLSSNTIAPDNYGSGGFVFWAVNFTTGKAWVTTTIMQANNIPWNNAALSAQNPATGTGGISIAALGSGLLYPAMGSDSTSGFILNTGGKAWASPLGTPSGFTPWG